MSAPRLSLGLVALALFVAGCKPGTPSDIRVTDAGPSTVEVTPQPDGTQSTNFGADPTLVGRKRIRVNISTPTKRITVQNIVVSHWAAGNRSASRSVEKSINQVREPNTLSSFDIEIDDAAQFDVCSGFYYMFAATYRAESATTSTFISQPHLVLPTKKRRPNGTIEEALCPQPPGPDQ